MFDKSVGEFTVSQDKTVRFLEQNIDGYSPVIFDEDVFFSDEPDELTTSPHPVTERSSGVSVKPPAAWEKLEQAMASGSLFPSADAVIDAELNTLKLELGI